MHSIGIDIGFVGLTGIELIGDQGTAVPLVNANLHCNVADTHLMRLIDGHNVTTEMDCMWLTDAILDKRITITVTFDTDVYLTGMRIWNYNASLELSYCGVRKMRKFVFATAINLREILLHR